MVEIPWDNRTRQQQLYLNTRYQNEGQGKTGYTLFNGEGQLGSSTVSSYRGRNVFADVYVRNRYKPDQERRLKRLDWGQHYTLNRVQYDPASLKHIYASREWDPRIYPDYVPTIYDGFFLPRAIGSVYGDIPAVLSEQDNLYDMFAAGGTAINRTLPNQSALDLATTLGELRQDGLPKLPQLKKMMPKSELPAQSADFWLNINFAWRPLVSDILSLLEIVMKTERILDQYMRDAGKSVRRRYEFPDEVSTGSGFAAKQPLVRAPGSSIQIYATGGQYGAGYRGYGDVSWTWKHVQKTWFSGRYTYHFERQTGWREQLAQFEREARTLYGLTITPENIWNLTRWSWLADYFVNFGDVLGNLSRLGKDNLVLNHGYICRNEMTEVQYLHTGAAAFGPGNSNMQIPGTVIRERQSRYRASPYGFGLDQSAITPQQWSILGALGISFGDRLVRG